NATKMCKNILEIGSGMVRSRCDDARLSPFCHSAIKCLSPPRNARVPSMGEGGNAMSRVIAALLGFLSLAAPAFAQELTELSFGVIATDSSAAIRQRYEPLFQDLEKRLGMKVNFFFASDYAGMIQAMRFNKVQIARFGNKSAA